MTCVRGESQGTLPVTNRYIFLLFCKLASYKMDICSIISHRINEINSPSITNDFILFIIVIRYLLVLFLCFVQHKHACVRLSKSINYFNSMNIFMNSLRETWLMLSIIGFKFRNTGLSWFHFAWYFFDNTVCYNTNYWFFGQVFFNCY